MGSNSHHVLRFQGSLYWLGEERGTAGVAQGGHIESQTFLSDKDFQRISTFIYNQCGLFLPPSKKGLVETRLRRRVLALNLANFEAYCNYLFGCLGEDEEVQVVNLLTTHETWFFREKHHFTFLVKKAIPELMALHGAGVRRELNVWSAGCATGEEPYTLAMVLDDFRLAHPHLFFNYFVWATDICTQSLDIGQKGVYPNEKTTSIPFDFKCRYLLRSKNPELRKVRMIPRLRSKVWFRYLNLAHQNFSLNDYMDIIFLRNVIIYFDDLTQKEIINHIAEYIYPGGYLFLGHAETLRGFGTAMEYVAPAIFRKPTTDST